MGDTSFIWASGPAESCQPDKCFVRQVFCALPTIAGSMCCLSLHGPLFGPGGPAECCQADKCAVLPIVAGFFYVLL